MNFQSPLHRGRVFNPPLEGVQFPHAILSVPSSSGKGLQQRWHGQRQSFFEHLSVPSSSGKGLQLLKPALAMAGSMTFSPLFIGEGSSTSYFLHVFCADESLSVPSSSGKGLQRLTQKRRYVSSSPLSVPSSSGKGLQLCGAPETTVVLEYFQSPLHRGRVFNQGAGYRTAAASPFQSPLHRGRVFNPFNRVYSVNSK